MFDKILPVLRENPIMESGVLIELEVSTLIGKFVNGNLVDCAFSTAGFSHQTQRLSLPNGEADIINSQEEYSAPGEPS
ncbi:unnamed protein product [marine sediment metagenome]|uniref:Uncharacterized protein n=1 Tax=marine sediment metagenome TaxID=412755 RepID=X1LGZ7_9ZZZZ